MSRSPARRGPRSAAARRRPRGGPARAGQERGRCGRDPWPGAGQHRRSGTPCLRSQSWSAPGSRSGQTRAGRVSASAACIAIQAPLCSRTQPLSPWWSGWMWVTTIPVMSRSVTPAVARPAVRARRPLDCQPGSMISVHSRRSTHRSGSGASGSPRSGPARLAARPDLFDRPGGTRTRQAAQCSVSITYRPTASEPFVTSPATVSSSTAGLATARVQGVPQPARPRHRCSMPFSTAVSRRFHHVREWLFRPACPARRDRACPGQPLHAWSPAAR